MLMGSLRCVCVIKRSFAPLLGCSRTWESLLSFHLHAHGAPKDRINTLPPLVPTCKQVLDSMVCVYVVGPFVSLYRCPVDVSATAATIPLDLRPCGPPRTV